MIFEYIMRLCYSKVHVPGENVLAHLQLSVDHLPESSQADSPDVAQIEAEIVLRIFPANARHSALLRTL